MGKMQDAEDEAKGSIRKYVTEAEFRKQHSRLPIMTHRLSIKIMKKKLATLLITAAMIFGAGTGRSAVVRDSVLYIDSSQHEIPAYAFRDRTDFHSVDFGKDSKLIKIGEYAFLGCSSLKEIYLPDGITEIGEGCFRECERLEKARLPKKLKNVPKAMFQWCVALKKADLRTVKDIGSHSFAYCAKLESVSIPTGVTHIGNNAFYGCVSLRRVWLPATIKELESYAFADCKGLREATLPANGRLLGELIFSGCDELETLTIDSRIVPKFDCDSSIFDPDEKYNYARCVLRVPAISLSLYRAANGWRRFVKIVPIR